MHIYAVRFVNGDTKMTENNIYVPPQVKSELSDESEYDADPEEFDVYKRKYQLLLDRCEVLQQVCPSTIIIFTLTGCSLLFIFLEFHYRDGSSNCFNRRRTTRDWFIGSRESGSF